MYDLFSTSHYAQLAGALFKITKRIISNCSLNLLSVKKSVGHECIHKSLCVLFWSRCSVILLSSEYGSDLDTVTLSNIHQMLQGLFLEQLRPTKYLQQGCQNNPPLLCVEGKGDSVRL